MNAVKAHMKHGDDMFSELTQTCEVSIAASSGTGSLLALAAAALAAGLGIGVYARRK